MFCSAYLRSSLSFLCPELRMDVFFSDQLMSWKAIVQGDLCHNQIFSMSYKIMLIVLCSSILIPILTGPLSHTSGPVLCKLTKYYMSFFNVTLKRTKKIHEWHTKYGPVVCVGPSEISVASPPLMKEIYGYADKYDKSEFFDNFLAYGERPVFAVRDCQEHRQKRRLIAPFYRAASKPWIVKMVDTRVSALLSQIKEREQQHVSLDVFPVLSYYAFDNISELLLGARNCAHALNGERDTCQILDDLKHTQVWGPLVFDFPRVSAVVQRVLRALKLLPASLDAEERLSDWSRQKIHEAFCGKGPEEGTLLYHLVNTRDAKGEALCMDYIASELYDNLNAAQVTVAVTLVYIIYNLSKHHVWQSKLRKEILDLVTEGHESPTFADVEKARVLEAIIRETYRLNPGTGGHAERVVPDGGKLYSGVYVPERV